MSDASTVETACPRCGRPIMWASRRRDGQPSIEAVRASCDCQLTDDEAARLADVVRRALADLEADGPR